MKRITNGQRIIVVDDGAGIQISEINLETPEDQRAILFKLS